MGRVAGSADDQVSKGFLLFSLHSSVSVPSCHVISTYVRASRLAACFFRRRASAIVPFSIGFVLLPATGCASKHHILHPPIDYLQQIMLASAARHVAALSGSSRSSAWRSAAAAAMPSLGSHASFSSKSNDDDVYSEEGISHDGEWAGCTRRFLPPIKIAVRGSEILTNPLCECCAAGIPPTFLCLAVVCFEPISGSVL